jgi:magnesium chelatase family protein
LNNPAGYSEPPPAPPLALPRHADGDFADVVGQALARRALEVAAAGGHNTLLVGPPGSGKTMMARRVSGILPPLTFDEALEATAIHSVAGLIGPGCGLMSERPFRAPHHTVSDVALVGGGSIPRPGEISLAHHGVLFLDEMPEFSRRVLEVLRQPLEEGCVRISRASRTAVFPARFMLIGAMNPCPCGYRGDPTKPCRCTPLQADRYASRLSGPLRDRIDLSVAVNALPAKDLEQPPPAEGSESIRGRVVAARSRQIARAGRLNSQLQGTLLRRHVGIDAGGRRLLERALQKLALTARGFDRLMRVSRTIADLEGSEPVAAEHLAEALQFRGEA